MNVPIIIGAGVSGLSCANYLVDNGIQPIIIDSDVVGKTKVCGEFFSSESIPFLKRWEIPYIEIEKANFVSPLNKYSFNLPSIAASTCRSKCEIALAQRANRYGTEIIQNCIVQKIFPAKTINDSHYIALSDGRTLETNKLIITTGKIVKSNIPKPTNPLYVGIKAHFTDVNIPNELNLFVQEGAYLGITYIESNKINVCCLVKQTIFDKFETPQDFINDFCKKNPSLNETLKNAKQIQDNWLLAPIYEFGKKPTPTWPNTYFIGDAASTIYPAAGNGLAMGLTAGVMAAQHIINNSQTDFKAEWNLRYSKRLNYAYLLNSILTSQKKSNFAFKLVNLFPNVAKKFYKLTRELQ